MNETMKAVIRYLDALGLSKSIRNIKEEMSKIYKYINIIIIIIIIIFII